MPRAQLLGGPWDGGTIASRHDPFVYVGGAVEPRGYSDAGPGRVLYRRASAALFIYAQHTHMRCASCGAWSERVARCRLCGAPAV